MKIAFFTSTLENSGPVNIIFNIIKDLKIEKKNIKIYTLSEEKPNTRKNEFIKLGCSIECLNMKKLDIIFGNINNLEKKLRNEGIDIIHSHCFRSTLLISKIKKIKKIATIHSNVGLDYKINFGFFKGIVMKKLFYNSLKKLDLNIACSRSLIKFYKNKKIKLKYIQNGVDLEKFKKNKNKKDLRERLGLEENKKYFVSVGSLCKRKDPLFIVKALEKIERKDFKVIFLGEGEEKNEIFKKNDERIILRGKVNNVKEYLEASDYFISASKSEGLPNSVIEALAMKLPILLSDISAHKEILEINRKAGECFKLNEVNSLVEELNVLLKKNYKELQNEAYKIVKDTLNSNIMSSKYLKEYKSLLESRKI